jgi:hypothetical protein
VGDTDSLLSSFTAEERRELVDENPYLTLEPPLTADEIAAFRDASVDVQSVFLRIGGDNAEAILNRVLSISG